MAKQLTKNQIRCQDCPYMVDKNGKWTCEECFGQFVEDIDDCPEGVTAEQIEELDRKSKENKIAHNAKSTEVKDKVKRERKPDEEKEQIIAETAHFLEEMGFENVKITNIGKIIEFSSGDSDYKFDLIRKRKPKT